MCRQLWRLLIIVFHNMSRLWCVRSSQCESSLLSDKCSLMLFLILVSDKCTSVMTVQAVLHVFFAVSVEEISEL